MRQHVDHASARSAMKRSISLAAFALAATSVPALAQFKPPQVPNVRAAPVAKPVYAANFSLGEPQCSPSLTSTTVPVSARVFLPPALASATKVRYDVHVNGGTTGTATATVMRDKDRRPYFNVSRTVTLRTASAETQLRLYVDGRPFGNVETLPTPCQLRGRPDSREVPSLPILEDLSIGPWLIVEYAAPRPRERPSGGFFAPTLSAGRRTIGFRNNVLIENDFRRTLPIYRQTGSLCPTESDAFVTVSFFVSLVGEGISAENYFPHERSRYFAGYSTEKIEEGPAYYWDTRGGSLPAEPDERPFPAGYEWAEFHRVLPCTRNGIFEFTIDRDNRLRERDETNNTVRIRYATVPPQ